MTASLRKGIDCMDKDLQGELCRLRDDILDLKKGLSHMMSCPETCRVDVILITYNHEKYIEESLQSILRQVTRFSVNIIVADDCSQDNTVEIIKRLESESGQSFTWLSYDHNHGIMKNYQRAFAACTAEYIAVMEGDDIWSDSFRLQRHVDFLDAHSECSMSFNRYSVKCFETGSSYVQPSFDVKKYGYYREYSGNELAACNYIGNFSTCVYRTEYVHQLPEELFEMKAYDWLTNLLMAKRGMIGCLWQEMNVYRVHQGGTWSGMSQQEQTKSILEAIEIYDPFTDYAFSDGFNIYRKQLRRSTLKRTNAATMVTQFASRAIRKVVAICNEYLPPIVLCCIKLLIPMKVQKIIGIEEES